MYSGPETKSKLWFSWCHAFPVCRKGLLFRQHHPGLPVVLLSFEGGQCSRRYVHDNAVGADGVELVRKTTWDHRTLVCMAGCVFTQNSGHEVHVEKWFSLPRAEFRSEDERQG